MSPESIISTLIALVVAGLAWFYKDLAGRVKQVEQKQSGVDVLKGMLDGHMREERGLADRLEAMDRRADERHIRLVERLTAVETYLKKEAAA